MAEKRYWFVAYQMAGDMHNKLLDEHPVLWCNAQPWHIVLTFYREISKETYEAAHGR